MPVRTSSQLRSPCCRSCWAAHWSPHRVLHILFEYSFTVRSLKPRRAKTGMRVSKPGHCDVRYVISSRPWPPLIQLWTSYEHQSAAAEAMSTAMSAGCFIHIWKNTVRHKASNISKSFTKQHMCCRNTTHVLQEHLPFDRGEYFFSTPVYHQHLVPEQWEAKVGLEHRTPQSCNTTPFRTGTDVRGVFNIKAATQID